MQRFAHTCPGHRRELALANGSESAPEMSEAWKGEADALQTPASLLPLALLCLLLAAQPRRLDDFNQPSGGGSPLDVPDVDV